MSVPYADAATLQTTYVRGFEGKSEGGFDTEWFTHLGKVRIRGVRQAPPNQIMEWKSVVVPRGVATPHVTFCWTGAMGAKPSPAGDFTIYVNGHPAADFDVTVHPTRFVARSEQAEFLYAVTWVRRDGQANDLDSSGYFYLTVPTKWVDLGHSATLTVRGKSVDSQRWFGLLDAQDAPLRMPQRHWIAFVPGEAPPKPGPANPPPDGEEASYEWYARQFTDPGVLTPLGPPGDPCQVVLSSTGQLFFGSDLTLAMRGSDYRIQAAWPVVPIKSLGFALYDGRMVIPVGTGEDAYQSLEDGHCPIVTTTWKHGSIAFRQTAFAEPLSGPYYTGLERTLAWAAVELTNTTQASQDVTLLAFYTGTNDQPCPTLEYRDSVLLMDGSAFVSAKAPGRFPVAFSPLFPATGSHEESNDPLELLRSHVGVFNALSVSGSLQQGETVRVVFSRVFNCPGTKYREPETLPPVAPEALTSRSFDDALERTRATCHGLVESIARFETPEPLINNTVRKAMLDGYFLTKRWDGRYVVFDSIPAGYLCQWDDASTKWFYALDLMGDHVTAEKLLDTVFQRQGHRKPAGTRTHEGCFSDVTNTVEDGSPASWASCNGWALWAIWQHARLSNDRAWLKRHKDKILAGCDWIVRERGFSREDPDSPFAGLLAGRFTCDSGDEAGYMVYTDSINYLGLHGIAQVLDDWGHPEGKRLLAEAEAYRKDILAAVDRATDKSSDPWYIPRALSDPGNDDLYHYGNTGPINLAFGGVAPADDERIDHVIRWILARAYGGSLEGLLTGSICHDRSDVSCCMFYSQDLAVVLLELDRVEEFLRILYTLLASNVTHQTLTTCEWRSNALPHIHSISSLIRMVRSMLIQERDGALVLLQGTPRRWLAHGQEITIRQAPTWYGPLSLHCVSLLNDGFVTIDAAIPERIGTTPLRLKLRLPHGHVIASATLDGGNELGVDGEWIDMTGLRANVRVKVTVIHG